MSHSYVSTHQFAGKWRLTVIQKAASYDQRFIVSGSASTNGTFSGSVGISTVVEGHGNQKWTLKIEHNDGSTGWQPSEVRLRSSSVFGSSIQTVVESEDIPIGGDRDFTDCVIRAEKLGMIDIPLRGSAILPTTMQLNPEGIFEKLFGRHFMAVTVTNIWSIPWPANATVGLTDSSRNLLASHGIAVLDEWHAEDLAALNQSIQQIDGRARVATNSLPAWDQKIVYFKVDVAGVAPDVFIQDIELDIVEAGAPDSTHTNRRADSKIWISQTQFDSSNNVFVSETDIGRMTAAVREMTVEYSSLKRAVARARELFGGNNSIPPDNGFLGGGGDGRKGCDERELKKLREQLRAFLSGKEVDLCDIWKRLQCCCLCDGLGGGGPGDDGPWSQTPPTGMEIIAIPHVIDFTIDYRDAFAGQYGPIPYEDPWWKIILAIIAIILSIAAAASAAADLANRSADTVIGQVTRSVLNPLTTMPDPSTITTATRGSVDAAVVTLNGERSLTGASFSYLDAFNGEDNLDPISALDAIIDTPGSIITNAEIDQLFQDIADNPGDTTFTDQLRIFKSGARTGTTKALLATGIQTVSPRRRNDGGRDFFINQINISSRAGAEVSNSGDSGSLWLIEDGTGAHRIIGLNHAGCTNLDATASRIEDVMEELSIRFA